MRDFVLTVCVLGSLPFCFARPWVGLLVWFWLAYMNPQRFTWGFAYSLPFSSLVAATTIGGFLVGSGRKPLPAKAPVYVLGLLWLAFFLSTSLAAINPEVAWTQLSLVSKIFLMTFLTLALFQDRRLLHLLALVTSLSIGFHGIKAGLWVVLLGVQQRVVGPPRTFVGDNNDLAMALNMVLPFFLFLRRRERRPGFRCVFLVSFLLCVIAVLMTYSRAGFMGLLVCLALIVVRRRAKVLTLTACVLLLPLVVGLLPEQWFARMQTISEYKTDASANARFTAWSVALGIVRDRPLLGAGFKPFTEEVYNDYAPGYGHIHDAHSIFFQMMAENGLIGLSLFIALIGTTLRSLQKSRRLARDHPSRRWITDFADTLQSSVLVYLVNGLFLGRAYFDLFYGLVAMTVLLEVLAEAASQASESVPLGPARGGAMSQVPKGGRPTLRRGKVRSSK